MADLFLAAVVSSFANIVLLAIIIGTYVQNLRLIKSYFTVGLVLVASFLLIQNLLIIGFWQSLYMESSAVMMAADMVSGYLFAINIAQTIGLSVLVWITRR
ncbi:MAG: hypothetical protein ACE5RJ_05270 [Nitrosopumilaceae archaeon]